MANINLNSHKHNNKASMLPESLFQLKPTMSTANNNTVNGLQHPWDNSPMLLQQ